MAVHTSNIGSPGPRSAVPHYTSVCTAKVPLQRQNEDTLSKKHLHVSQSIRNLNRRVPVYRWIQHLVAGPRHHSPPCCISGHGSNPRAPSASLFSKIALCTGCLTQLCLVLIQHRRLNDSLPVERLQLISSSGDSGSASGPFIPELRMIMSYSPINGDAPPWLQGVDSLETPV